MSALQSFFTPSNSEIPLIAAQIDQQPVKTANSLKACASVNPLAAVKILDH